MKHIMMLGRETDIAYAELAALYRENNLQRPLDNIALLHYDTIDFARLGSTKKAGVLIKETNRSIHEVRDALQEFITSSSREIHPKRKKINFAVSLYGDVDQPLEDIERTVERALTSKGFNTRRVPNESGSLSTAQVFHNKLDLSGFEFLIIGTEDGFLIGYTTEVQNIMSYRKRDQERPARDPELGMLPPKLAQTMVNLAAADTDKSSDCLVLDPFCGTGVVMQEALLMGFKAYGSDINQRVVDMCKKNMQWLEKRFNRIRGLWSVEKADATKHFWNINIDHVVSELYLGPPLKSQPSDNQLKTLVNDATELVNQTLENLHENIESGTRLCLGVPAWSQGKSVITLPLVDDLRGLGYNRIRFDTFKNELIYRRRNQIVGRHLLILERI